MAAQHKPIVISLGGSLIIPEEIDTVFLAQFVQCIRRRAIRGRRFAIICGGGRICRKYQAAAKNTGGATDKDLDWVGVMATRLNAELLRAMFGKIAHEKVVCDPTKKIATRKSIVIGAGYRPGCSSDWDAVEIARNIGATAILNLSNIEYVYDKDPKKYPDSRPIKSMTWQDFHNIIGKKWTPGLNAPFDPAASRAANKHKIKVIILSGNLENLERCLEGKEFRGTLIG